MKTAAPVHAPPAAARLDADDAIVALLVAAMEASGHVSPEEGARAHHLIWSMRRFRDVSGETMGQRIERMKTLIGESGAAAIIDRAARTIPARLRPATFAVAADLVLTDGRLERSEREFLDRLGADLRLDEDEARDIVDVMLVKNSA